MEIKTFKIDVSKIKSWDDFHAIFSKELSFPSYYGRNQDAWIDCMTDFEYSGIKIILNLEKMETLKKNNRNIYDSINELSAFLNFRSIEQGDEPNIYLSYDIKI